MPVDKPGPAPQHVRLRIARSLAMCREACPVFDMCDKLRRDVIEYDDAEAWAGIIVAGRAYSANGRDVTEDYRDPTRPVRHRKGAA